ncbi:hypothetical protein HYH03_002136 [Edaphochlamys debaryana]|uniref:1,3-beta-glucan synthase n=1 Tax=Edaphochlamys debaryana TaxID=47281 RepID=A0A835YBE1_9CHLO|nr:hypothetical protein HYH03_002136 [Edaphochlamys debaryana]|eukprot:KAG2499845.1 hypothetical protein HYH03_002136 [Edaphochlamys debaryana]
MGINLPSAPPSSSPVDTGPPSPSFHPPPSSSLPDSPRASGPAAPARMPPPPPYIADGSPQRSGQSTPAAPVRMILPPPQDSPIPSGYSTPAAPVYAPRVSGTGAASHHAAWMANLQSAGAAALAEALNAPPQGVPPLQLKGSSFKTSPSSLAAYPSLSILGPGKASGLVGTPSFRLQYLPSANASAIPHIPARLPAPAPPPLPEPPAAIARRPLCDRVQNTTWAVARVLGFQAFNPASPVAAPPPATVGGPSAPPQWVPATAFLAADHLETLLVRNMMPRLEAEARERRAQQAQQAAAAAADGGSFSSLPPAEAEAEDEAAGEQRRAVAFARAVWELHSHIFLPYEGERGWCRQVLLAPRPADTEKEVLCGALAADSEEVVGLLLLELCLYFLVWSEAANLRHTPELLWFLFWAARHGAAVDGLARQGLRPEQRLSNARQRRLAMRNAMQDQLSAARRHLSHDPSACVPEHAASVAAALAPQLPTLLPSLTSSAAATACQDAGLPCAPSRKAFADLAAFGDGGFWTDCVVSPLFTVIAWEMDAGAAAGQEVAQRLGYDDVNESLCRRDVVGRLLAELGVEREAEAGQAHGALEAITRLGYPDADEEAEAAAADEEGGGSRRPQRAAAGSAPSASELDPRSFDVLRAAAFWLDRVFVKTHRERRSWLALLRAFHRVFSLQLTLLHATMAWAFAPGSLTALSSAVLTHAMVAAAERTANWWLSRGAPDPLARSRARDSWVTGQGLEKAAKEGDAEAAAGAAAGPSGPRRSRLSDGGAVEARMERRRRVAVEGAPVWGLGWLEWVLTALGLTGLFALQFMGPPALAPMAKAYWPMAAGGYVAAVVGHGLLTTRDGYAISLSAALRLPAFCRASSARPAAASWLAAPMAVGWGPALLTMLFWLQVLAAKVAFDYFVILRPMAGQIRFILERNWLSCATASSRHYRFFGTELPLACIDGDWLLVGLRVAPFVLVCLIDTQIFYQLVLMAWGLVQGLMSLNLGIAGSWEGLRAEFHRTPLRWWGRGMSRTANDAARAAAAAALSKRRAAALEATGGSEPTWLSDDEDESYGCPADGPYGRNSYGSTYTASTGSPTLREEGEGAAALPTPRRHRAAPLPLSRPAAESEAEGGKGKAKAKAKGKSGADRDAAAAAELVAMLSGQGEEQLAQWVAFAAAWDAVVSDLRSCDLISDRERTNLVFTRLPAAATAMAGASAAGSAVTTPSAAAADAAAADGSLTADGASSTASRSSARPLRPILLPAFFYAGQLQRAVDTGAASPQQQMVVGELRALLVWLGCQLRLFDGAQAAALLAAPALPASLDSAHCRSREKGLAALRKLLAALTGLAEPLPAAASAPAGEGQRRRQALYGEAREALEGVLTAAEVEARAVLKKGAPSRRKAKAAAAFTAAAAKYAAADDAPAAPADPPAAAAALLEAAAAIRSGLLQRPERLEAALALLHPESNGRGEVPCASQPDSPASVSSASAPSTSTAPSAASTSVRVDLPLLRRVLATAAKMASLSAAAAQPTGAEARRVLSFFVTSLANRQMTKPCPVAAMASWTVLTPIYAEAVLFPLEAKTVAESLGLPAGKDPAAALPDLLTETEDRVSLMAYLRSMFPKDWENFKERLGCELGGVDLSAASELDFAEGGPLAEHALALQLWASNRGQVLARTVRGMACYERALRVLVAMEQPRRPGEDRLEHAAAVEDTVSSKFAHVVASQLYGKCRRSSNLRERWLAESTDVLLETFPGLRVSFLDAVPLSKQQQQEGYPAASAPSAHHFAVLIRARRPGGDGKQDRLASASGATAAAAAAAVASARAAAGGRTEELYRVRLPYNRYSGRGVIVGEGKPENQNAAVMFCFGEALQTIDMNQDNALAEALKMRNLLQELAPERTTRAAKRAEQELSAALEAPAAPAAAAASAPTLPPASELRRLLSGLRSAERPVAIVGFREWVFSDKAGALGAFAASAEFAFGTLVQRTMAYPANVRLHYGHPDAFNKLFTMTRGGMAKASRQLHVSEDVFGGMNAALRGGVTRYREYISVGKGRDTGFDSINAFENKISAGFGEVALSRDLLRMGTRTDLWRCLHLYHSLVGNYFNTWLVMGSVYAHIYALLFFALAQAAVYRVIVYYPSPPPPPLGTPDMPAIANAPPPPAPVIKEVLGYDTIRVEHVLQLGLLSLLPYVAEVALEQGLLRGIVAALAQVLSGSFTFFIFKQQTTASALHKSVLYGGASYIATGRGFSITSSSFIKLWANYGRSHMALGFELAAMAIALAATNDCARCSYAGLTWGTWLAALSLILAPCWFNPMAFSPAKVKRDINAWAAWLRGEVDRELGVTWHQWNRRQLAASRDEAGTQTDRGGNVMWGLALGSLPPAMLAFAAASRLTLRLDGLAMLPGPFRSSWAFFLAVSALLWLGLAAAARASRRFGDVSDRRRWRLWAFWVGAGSVAACVVFLVGATQWYSGPGPANMALIAYANINIALALHRGLEHAAPRSRTARRLVDGGHAVQDWLVGWSVLLVLGVLSLLGLVSRIQTTLLFNVTFAKSVKRGSLVKTIGLAKEERGQQAALVGMVMAEGDEGSVLSGGSLASRPSKQPSGMLRL